LINSSYESTGKRFLESKTKQRGGARQRDPTKDRIAVFHEDAEAAVEEMLASAKKNKRNREREREREQGEEE
jgi:hypothetical protein